jgi:pimeloyl-ACP methyl ester carboxylesterase
VLDVRFARSGEVDVAYFVVGTGQLPLVWVMGAYQHLETAWCGMGMSSRVAGSTPFETRMDDIRAVLDAEQIERAALLGESEGGPLAMLFAAAHPERVTQAALQGAEVRERQDDDWPWGYLDEASFEQRTQERIRRWGQPMDTAGRFFGGEAADQAWLNEWIARLQRNAASPREYAGFARTAFEADARNVARSVRVPTLVMHCAGDRVCHVENGRFLARVIPGATYVERPGAEHIPWLNPNGVLPDIREFLTGERESVEPDRVLATILFSDVVGSTARASAMGDEQWRSLLQTHHAAVRDAFARFRGQEVTAEGDGFLARFDGPARAIRCARAIIDDARRIGLQVRAGVHTGEVEVIGADVAGIALHIGARIGTLAQGGQVLVSGAVRDIVAGSASASLTPAITSCGECWAPGASMPSSDARPGPGGMPPAGYLPVSLIRMGMLPAPHGNLRGIRVEMSLPGNSPPRGPSGNACRCAWGTTRRGPVRPGCSACRATRPTSSAPSVL